MNKYNQLTVLEEVNQNKRWMYKVQCDCGKVEIKRKDWVISGRTTSCKSCASKRTAKNYPPPTNRKGCQGLSGTHFLSIKNGALRRKIAFDLTPEFLWELYLKQDGRCALTNIPLTLDCLIRNNNVDWKYITASLDRIDNTKPYIESNVWWVHKTVNRLKNNYSLEELLYWSKLLLEKHGNPDPSVANEIEVATKEQRLGIEDSTNNMPTSARHPDPVKHCLVYKQDGCCHVDGFLCDYNTCDIRLNWMKI
jgi:hypothetical protein